MSYANLKTFLMTITSVSLLLSSSLRSACLPSREIEEDFVEKERNVTSQVRGPTMQAFYLKYKKYEPPQDEIGENDSKDHPHPKKKHQNESKQTHKAQSQNMIEHEYKPEVLAWELDPYTGQWKPMSQ